MKKLLLASVAALGICITAWATLPTFKSVIATGGAAGANVTNCTVFFPADPNSQIRLISLLYKSDTNTGAFTFSTGNGAYYVPFTNAAAAVTNFISSTNGLLATSVVLLQTPAGLCYTSTISSYGNSGAVGFFGVTNLTSSTTYGPAGSAATNLSWIVVPTGGWTVVAPLFSDIYQMSPVVSGYVVGASSNVIASEAIFVGNYGRPVMAQLGPPGVANACTASAHYDGASN